MNMQSGIDVLECGPCWGRGFGGRSKLPIEAVIIPVHGRTTVFSLPHAALAAGLLPKYVAKSSLQFIHLAKAANRVWRGSMEEFFKSAAKLGITTAAIDQTVSRRGVIIGYPYTEFVNSNSPEMGICTDLTRTIAVLSRRAGNLFIPAREPDYSWNALFGHAFLIDEDTQPSPNIDEKPWCDFMKEY